MLDGAGSNSAADPYDLLGIEASAPAADIKRRFWRMSLLTHPDKCPHPRAKDAFDAVSQAAKALQVRGAFETYAHMLDPS